jgi:tape measure domain-containing protein
MAQIQTIYSPEVEKQLKAVYGELEKHHKKVVEMSKLSLDFAGGKTAQNPAQLQAVTNAYQNLNRIKTEVAKKTAEEIVNQKALAQNADRVARANSQLVGSYARLNAQYAIAEKRVLDLRASQTASNREIRQAQKEFDRLRSRILAADQAVGRWNRSSHRTIGIATDLMSAFGIVGGVTMFAMLTRDTVRLIKELESLNLALKQVSDGEYANNVVFLQKISEDFGLSINDLTKQFTQFYVTAKDKISANEIQQIFTSISKAGATMGLSTQQQERAFLALNQMMSKGTVQAEELRGQLGEALPGAFSIMAKAVGVTEKELGNMMQRGELLANEVLPKFARELEKAYGIENVNRVQTLTAETNRLSNAWVDLVNSFDNGNGVISRVLRNAVSLMTSFLNLLKTANKDLQGEAVTRGQENATTFFNEYIDGVKKAAKARGASQKEIDAIVRKSAEEEMMRLKMVYESDYQTKQKRLKELEDFFNQQSTINKALNPFQTDKLKREYQELKISTEMARGQVLGLKDAYQNFLNPVIEKNTEIKNENTNATTTNTTAKKEERLIVVGSVEWLEKEIALLKEKQKQLSTTAEEYQSYNQEIEVLNKTLDMMIGKLEKAKDLGGVELDLTEDLDEVVEGFANFEAEMRQRAKGALDAWAGQNGFPTLFAILNKDLEGFGNNWYDTTQGIIGATQEMVNFISQITSQNFQQQYEALEQQKAVDILFAGESVEARERIEEQYEERRRQIQKRQAEAQKKLAIFNIVTNTAKGVVAALGTLDVPLSILIGAIGAAQLAFVASQQIPQFWTGTDNAPGGLAWTQEKGQEIITDKYGNIKDFGDNKGARLTMLEQGDKVFNAEHTKRMLFNRELQGVLNLNGISSNGLTKQDFNDGINRLIQRDGININIDKNGFATSIVKGNTRRNQLNNNLRLKGNAV